MIEPTTSLAPLAKTRCEVDGILYSGIIRIGKCHHLSDRGDDNSLFVHPNGIAAKLNRGEARDRQCDCFKITGDG